MNKKGLTKTQLQLIAIIAMVVDHTAWGFVDFMSPLGQLMHIFGRLTLPIMCFFIAEGYRNTSNLRQYVSRMISFSLIAVIPFYIFFHEEYGYRQNIIFDELLALLALCAYEHKQFSKPLRLLLVGLIVVISALIGGWVIMPIIYVFVFYYGKDFKEKAKNFIIATVVFEAVLISLILLNQRYHFSGYNWTVAERLYLVFFVIALIPLSRYNGQRGKIFASRYFFYIFYPAHFLVLSFIKYLLYDYTPQGFYIMVHVIALAIALFMLVYVVTIHSSRAQHAVTVFMITANLYIFGFLLEITTHEVAGVYTATKLQYFAECLLFISITYCMQELCHTRIPYFVYVFEFVMSVFIMYCMFTYEKNGLMYSAISIENTAGSFPRMEIESYGIAFYVFVLYSAAVCLLCIAIGLRSAKTGDELQRKRLRCLLYAMLVMWLPLIVKITKITNGYEIPVLGIPFAAIFVAISLGKYSYLDSVSLDFSNALNKGNEGVLIIDRNHRVLYHNEWVHELFGSFNKYDDAYGQLQLSDIFEEKQETLEKDGHKFDLRVEPLIEQGHSTGKILWIIDLTEHYKILNKAEESAATDSLTGINNRGWFEEKMSDIMKQQRHGALFMLDLDSFKTVNDTYGHQAGDDILIALSSVIKEVSESSVDNPIISGRMGGDEFCLFMAGKTERTALSAFSQKLIDAFDKELETTRWGNITSVSIGVAVLDRAFYTGGSADFATAYKRADYALYQSKDRGKKSFTIYV